MNKRRLLNIALIFSLILSICCIALFEDEFDSFADSGSDQVTVMLTGDVMCDFKYQNALYDRRSREFDFDNTFRLVKPLLQEADIVVGNLEGNYATCHPISRYRHRYQGKPFLNAPESFLKSLRKAGFDGFVMANNHNCDTYKTGISQTIQAVEKNGFRHTGLYSTSQDKHYFIIRRNGIRIAFLSYATYFNTFEGRLSKASQDTMLSVYSKTKVADEIAEARRAGADYCIVYIHKGPEFKYTVTDRQKEIMKEIAESGADYIVGSHPHVLQETGTVSNGEKDIPCVYSMGNFTGKLTDKKTRETAILQLTLGKNKAGKTVLKKDTFIPCYMADKSEFGKMVLIPEGQKCRSKKLTKSLKKHYRKVRKILK